MSNFTGIRGRTQWSAALLARPIGRDHGPANEEEKH